MKSKLFLIVIIADIILGVLIFWLNASYGLFTNHKHLIDVSSTIPGHTITLTDKNGLEVRYAPLFFLFKNRPCSYKKSS